VAACGDYYRPDSQTFQIIGIASIDKSGLGGACTESGQPQLKTNAFCETSLDRQLDSRSTLPSNATVKGGIFINEEDCSLPVMCPPVGVHNWTDLPHWKVHPPEMNDDRIQEITNEMCDLLNAQIELLKSPTTFLSGMSGEEVDGYQQRNNRLRQLGAELSEPD
jgi:hypothetical protein